MTERNDEDRVRDLDKHGHTVRHWPTGNDDEPTTMYQVGRYPNTNEETLEPTTPKPQAHVHEPLLGREVMEGRKKGWMPCACGVEHSGPWWSAYEQGVADATKQ
jgi:hypothetical protein